jgi:hypothetical protein
MTEDAEAKRKTERGTNYARSQSKGHDEVYRRRGSRRMNLRQANLVLAALPGKRDDKANTAILSGMSI